MAPLPYEVGVQYEKGPMATAPASTALLGEIGRQNEGTVTTATRIFNVTLELGFLTLGSLHTSLSPFVVML